MTYDAPTQVACYRKGQLKHCRPRLSLPSRFLLLPPQQTTIIPPSLAAADSSSSVYNHTGPDSYIWEGGYQSGDYYTHVYADTYEKLKDRHKAGIDLHIFSSGSVYAQKLLFTHTEYGDLTPLFSGYCDTNIGAKIDPKSYATLAEHIARPPAEILFLSDMEQELVAAKSAGLSTIRLVRDGSPNQDSQHPQVTNFLTV